MQIRRHIVGYGLLVVTVSACAQSAPPATPPDLPPPADRVQRLGGEVGRDMGLPLGAGPAYQIGRTLAQQGDPQAALPYLNQAFRMAPDVERIGATYLDVLVATGYESDALNVVSGLVRLHPGDMAYRRRHAALLARAGQYRQALDEVQQVQAAQVDDVDLVKLECELRERLGEVDRALTVAAAAEDRFPDARQELVVLQAAILRRADRRDDLEVLLRSRLGTMPTSVPIRQALLRALVERKDLAAALVVAEEGDALPSSGDAETKAGFQIQLADMLVRDGRYPEAVDVLNDLRSRGQADQDAQLWLTRLLVGLGRNEQAKDILGAILERWPRAGEAHYLRGKVALGEGDAGTALASLRQAVSLAPDRVDFRLALLQGLLTTRRDALAATAPTPAQQAVREELSKQAEKAAFQVHPRDAAGHLILGYAYEALDELEKAARQFEAAGEVNDVRVQAMLELSLCYERMGETSRAGKTLENLRQEFPDQPEVANTLGYFLAERGTDLGRAEDLVRQALKDDPVNGAYLDSLGWVLYKRGDHAAAFDQLVEAANQRPEDPVILEHLGLTLRALGRSAEALNVLRRCLAAGGETARIAPVIKELESDEQ